MNAEQATDIAVEFLKKYRFVVRPLRASIENGVWLVEIDVGLYENKIATVRVNAENSEIESYEIPP